MRIEINNKSWYDLSDFSSYDEIEELGEITGTNGIPDCVDVEDDWDSIQEYLKLADEEQAIMLAYAEANSVFDWEEASEAFVGRYADGAGLLSKRRCPSLPDWYGRSRSTAYQSRLRAIRLRHAISVLCGIGRLPIRGNLSFRFTWRNL